MWDKTFDMTNESSKQVWWSQFALNKFDGLNLYIDKVLRFPHIFNETQSFYYKFLSLSQCALSIGTFTNKVHEYRKSGLTFTHSMWKYYTFCLIGHIWPPKRNCAHILVYYPSSEVCWKVQPNTHNKEIGVKFMLPSMTIVDFSHKKRIIRWRLW